MKAELMKKDYGQLWGYPAYPYNLLNLESLNPVCGRHSHPGCDSGVGREWGVSRDWAVSG
jgi:hypothetical protein